MGDHSHSLHVCAAPLWFSCVVHAHTHTHTLANNAFASRAKKVMVKDTFCIVMRVLISGGCVGERLPPPPPHINITRNRKVTMLLFITILHSSTKKKKKKQFSPLLLLPEFITVH